MKRTEQKTQRRAALLDGAVAVLLEHGLEGFTTGRIAASAGITQSAFYKYWPGRQAALVAVAEHVGDRLLLAIRGTRLAAGPGLGQLGPAFSGALKEIMVERDALTLLLRYRRSPGPLGDMLRALMVRARQELHTDMVALGLVQAGDPLGFRLAIYAVAVTIGGVEALLDGDMESCDELVADLSAMAEAVLVAQHQRGQR